MSGLARLHRRLAAGMALAALWAYAAGSGWTADAVGTAVALLVSFFWLPSAAVSVWIERITRVAIVALCAWMLYVAFAVGGDFMPAVMAMLLVLLGAEGLRSIEAKNDGRLYLLSFSLLIAGTAFYPGLAFALAFAAFVVLSTLAMMVGYLRRQSERFGGRPVRVGRRMLGVTAALSAVTLAVSVGFFVLFPRLPRQWNVQGRNASGEAMIGFGDAVELRHGGRLVGNPETALRVEFPDGAPPQPQRLYWRGRSFDRFDGIRWWRTRGLPGQPYTAQAYRQRWGGPSIRARIFGGPPGANVLFGPHPILNVQPRSAIRVFQEPSGDVLFYGSDAPVYTVTSGRRLPPERLLQASPERPSPLVEAYLQLPRLDPAVRRLADSLTAGLTTRVDRARAIERYLRGFRYTLDLPSNKSEATVEAFLFRRKAGHCEYFSTAMVVLLREIGIPARNVTGFLGGEWNEFGSYLAVTENDAHSWVEVWFPELGWVPFDPTPPSRGDVVEDRTGTGWTWPARFWFDGLEHRWYKWVLDYDLEKQLDLFRGVGDLFRRENRAPSADRGARGTPRVPPLVPVAVGIGVAIALLAWLRRGRGARRSAETRAYQALRRAYGRAGLDSGGGPLDFAESLVRSAAPGAASADALVRLYLRARFGGQPLAPDEEARMKAALDESRAALRGHRRE